MFLSLEDVALVWSITIVDVENIDMFICGPEGGGGVI